MKKKIIILSSLMISSSAIAVSPFTKGASAGITLALTHEWLLSKGILWLQQSDSDVANAIKNSKDCMGYLKKFTDYQVGNHKASHKNYILLSKIVETMVQTQNSEDKHASTPADVEE